MVETHEGLMARRRVEDILLAYREEGEWLEHQEQMNRLKVRALLPNARAVGITLRDISELSGVSRQTLHQWMKMEPIPEIHFGLTGPSPASLEEAVLRTMGERPSHDWKPAEVRQSIPAGWPAGDDDSIGQAMEFLARTRRIWDGEVDGYRIMPPSDLPV